MAVTGSTLRFRYRAARPDGTVVRSTLEAPSVAVARKEIERQGLTPISLTRSRRLHLQRPVTQQDLAVLFASTSSLVAAGMPVERALAASEVLVGERLKSAVGALRRRVREGDSLGDAMALVPAVFPPVTVGVVRAGERASRLGESLAQIAGALERDAKLRAEVQSTLAYPALIAVVGAASVAVMGLVVIPRFATVLDGLGGTLPSSTRMLLAVAETVRRYFVWLALGGAAAVGAALHLWSRPENQGRIHSTLLRLPLVGPIRFGYASARVCRSLGAMLGSGMPLLSALDASARAAGDAEVGRRLGAVRTRVERGEGLSRSMGQEAALSPLALQLLGVGEATGDLATLCTQAGEVAADRAGRTLRTAVSLLEPLLVVSLGVMVALIAAALLQAVYSVRPGG